MLSIYSAAAAGDRGLLADCRVTNHSVH
jgi:hypothetical protein